MTIETIDDIRSTPSDIRLRQMNLAPVSRPDAVLLDNAMVGVTFYPAKRSKQYWAPSWAAHLCKYLDHLRHVREAKLDCLKRLIADGYAGALGSIIGQQSLDPCDVRPSLARVLKRAVVVGPVRINVDETFDLQDDDGRWHRATDELVCALDAQARLGGPRSRLNLAAEIVLEALEREKKRHDKNNKRSKTKAGAAGAALPATDTQDGTGLLAEGRARFAQVGRRDRGRGRVGVR